MHFLRQNLSGRVLCGGKNILRKEIRSRVFGCQIFEKGNSYFVGDIGVARRARVSGNLLYGSD
jgi:hypothetical protein